MRSDATSAISRARASGARIDAIDVIAVLFIVNGLVYRIAPGVLTPGPAPGQRQCACRAAFATAAATTDVTSGWNTLGTT